MQPSRNGSATRAKRSFNGLAVSAVLIALVAQLFAAPIAAAATPQTISFSLPPSGLVGSTVELSAVSDSGLAVTYTTSTADSCAIDVATLTLVAPGICTVTASQAGDDSFAPAVDVEASMAVEPVASDPPPPDPTPQTITFSLPASGFVGSSVGLSGIADSGLLVAYATSTPDACAIDGENLSLVAVGTCTVTASQQGNEVYAAAADVEASIAVDAAPPEPLPQLITFSLPESGAVDSTIELAATADSGLTVAYATSTPDFCAIAGTTLSLVAVGTCSVTASQPGDDAYAAAIDVTVTVAVLMPQTISFELPSSGLKGGTVPLVASADSELVVSLVATTPAVCFISGPTLNLGGVGICSITASQAGDATWAAADDVVATITVKLPPLTTPGGDTNLGRYAFNGPIRAMAVDPATGIAYVAGSFTQVGIRTGSLAIIDAPDSGSDQLKGTSPDVIGVAVSVFADDSTGFFMSGIIDSIRGDGIERHRTLVRMTADGHVDPSWQASGWCGAGPISNQGAFDTGEQLVERVGLSASESGLSTVGVVFIDKATGNTVAAGAGSTCDGSTRILPSVGPFEPLAACSGWSICDGQVYDLTVDNTTNVLITAVTVLSRESALGPVSLHWYRMAYDLGTGARLWTREEDSYGSQMIGLGGALLAVGSFPTEGGPSSTAILLDEATGEVLQRWNASGEQDPSDPTVILEPAGLCLPNDMYENPFTRLDASSAARFGASTDIPGGKSFQVCSYGLAGSGLAARLTATVLGTFDAGRDVGGTYALPTTMYVDRYLVGGSGAFDLDTGTQVDGWNPAPSTAPQSGIVVGSSVVFSGSFAYVNGTRASYIAAIDRDLAPVPGFSADLGLDPSWVNAIGFADGRVIAVGSVNAPGGYTPIAALDAQTGAVDWTQPQAQFTEAPWRAGSALAVDPATNDLYVGYLGSDSNDVLTRFIPDETGFAIDPTFNHAFEPLGTTIAGNPAWSSVTALGLESGRLYIGGTFGSVDGHPRQGLARLDVDGALDAWAPALVDELAAPADAEWQLQPRSFIESASSLLVAGQFAYYTQTPDQQYHWNVTTSDVLAYSVDSGARVRPLGSNAAWFDNGLLQMSGGAYATVLMDGTIYVALGIYGIAAFDSTTLDYLPSQSIRTQIGWTDTSIYALAARAPDASPLNLTSWKTRAGARMPIAASDPASSIVVGGVLNRWKNDTAGNVVELTEATAPGAQAAPTVVRGNGSASVTWQEPSSDGGASITAYTATAFPGGRSCPTTGTLGCTITGLSPATRYTVTVTATNNIGTGPASATSSGFWPDVSIPTASAPSATPRNGSSLSGMSIPLHLDWTGADVGGSGVAAFELAKSTNGGTTWTTVSASVAVAAFDLTVASTGTIRFRVRAIDHAGNIGAWATGTNLTPRLTQQSSTAVKYKGTWTSTSSSSLSGSSAKYAKAAGASATWTFSGRSIALVTTTAPTRGKVKVYVNGALVATIDLRSSTTKYRVLAWQKSWPTSATRTVKLVVVGTSGRPRVDLDAFAVLK